MSQEVKDVMDHFDLSEGALNLKILQNVYMKNLRFISYDPENSIANLEKVLVLSNFLCGPTIQFKYSQVNFEIGKALSSSLAQVKLGREYIEKGR